MTFEPQSEETYRVLASEFAALGASMQEQGVPFSSVVTCMVGAVIMVLQEADVSSDKIPDHIATCARAMIHGPPS